jgi:hypothetical protein
VRALTWQDGAGVVLLAKVHGNLILHRAVQHGVDQPCLRWDGPQLCPGLFLLLLHEVCIAVQARFLLPLCFTAVYLHLQ